MEIESAREFRTAVMTISLKRAEEAVQLGEARFQQLTHALLNPIWSADDEGQLTYVNQRWRDLGLDTHGRWYEQEQLTPEEQARCSDLWKTSVANGTPFEVEIKLRRPRDGAEQWNLLRSIPFHNSDQARAGWVGTCIDLTDRRERETAQRMTEKLALTGRMTSVIAHEINNPLAAITNLLYLIGLQVASDGPVREYIDMAEIELERISGITKQTLRWSKESELKPEYGTADKVFEEVLRLFKAKRRNRHVIASIADGSDVQFYGIIGQVRQVLANLVSNALDAVPDGGWVRLEARLEAQSEASLQANSMEMLVIDNGPGMSEEVLRKIFQPFFSTKGDLGNGLGLYISQEIAERHGGKLIVESTLGAGTTIRFRIPTLPPAQAQLPAS